jgi:hypothetical protein
VAGDRGATDARQGATKDEFESLPFDFRTTEVVAEVVEDGTGDFGGQGPCFVPGKSGSFLDGEYEPVLA